MKKRLQDLSIGLLGGGQLGRMLLQEAANLDLKIAVMDPSEDAPCRHLTFEFVHGDFRDFDAVYAFGKDKDIVTIEFEDVNADALEELEKNGVQVFPEPRVLKLIKDKGLQKQFYNKHQIPTAPFVLIKNKEDILNSGMQAPFFQKLRTGGYDGYGVRKITTLENLEHAFDKPSVLEATADIEKEISVIVSRNTQGEIATFPVVEMEFNPESNMVQFLFAPSTLPQEKQDEARNLAVRIIEALKMTGILAVEMFYLKNGEIWVNEMAPRPHNSGHHTIEANFTSQYEQHLRAITGLPPGNTGTIMPSVMVNLLGEKGYTGKPVYHALDEVLKLPGVYIHLYGKSTTKDFRKMGHVTILAPTLQEAKEKGKYILNTLRVKA
ncbi:MAG: 5-(carboxyamino)imidazole ribonucleotide synthase [Flavobacteriales bacterium]|nr:5-(carboxyamino)imidazole ribonucleotide synthase [Flavobacteriales bacterium]